MISQRFCLEGDISRRPSREDHHFDSPFHSLFRGMIQRRLLFSVEDKPKTHPKRL
jgi:hypothetical protein